MPDAPNSLPLLRLGRLELNPELRTLQPGQDASGLVATATVEVPDSVSEPEPAWDVALADAAREAAKLGADERTAQALAAGAGNALAGGTWIVVAAHGQVLIARRLPHGAATPEVRVGPLPHLLQAAAFAARRPAHVVLLADRGDAAVIAHAAGEERPARRFGAPGTQRDTHPDRPPAQLHGERHVTDSEPESGGERNAASIAARVSEAAASVGAHIVLGAGDQHILDAVAEQLAEQQVAVLLVAADLARDGDGASYRIGRRPTEFIVGDSDVGTEVPLEDGLVWAALHQDAIIVQLPERSGPLAGQPVAALLRRG